MKKRVGVLAVVVLLVGCGGTPDVPDVTGMDIDDATDAIEAAGYEVDVEEQVATADEVDTVLGQDPEPDDEVERDDDGDLPEVTLTVGSLQTITGTMLLRDRSPAFDGQCFGDGGYSDLREGAQVTVSDESGATIAVGELGRGESVESRYCEFSITVEDVPAATFYSIEVSRRGQLRYSMAEMERMDWEVGFSLG